jgi:lysophospholipase L1-like esterase
MTLQGRRTGGLRRALGNLALLAASVALSLLGGEVIARMLYPLPSAVMANAPLSTGPYYASDEQLGWLPRKSVQGSHDHAGSFASTFRTNSRGLRGKERDLVKPDGWQRVVLLGDSFTWGYGISDGETYADRLEGKLERTEVVNLGVTAYGLTQEIMYLKREGLGYSPDIVVVGFCLNDVYRPASAWVRYLEKQRNARSAEPAAPAAPRSFALAVKHFLHAESRLYRLAVDQLNRTKWLANALARAGMKAELAGFRELDPNLMPALRVYPPDLQESWEQTLADLLELRRLGEEHRFRLVVALIPALQTVQSEALRNSIAHLAYEAGDFDPDKPYRLVEEFARSNGIDVVNPVERFRAQERAGTRLYLRRDMHFNAAGHELFAQAIAEHINPLLRSHAARHQ